ncbi:F-box domain-containing protein [Mycena sanguinolenta]|uniref:F-box domain-containing protein n=1 Tax=Mycena sanguinolenta TaxID=230812 RepID=A0A8H7D6E3_9AGAR|nr:F-box domain-containing protein [Mycena sanguinolenta]
MEPETVESSSMSSIASDRIRLADLDAQILALENSLVTLENERKSVQARINAYVYPILTIPNEIISQFFIHTLPPYPLCSPLWGPSSPNALGQICRQWRDIALSTPMLWRAPSFILSSIWTPPIQLKDARSSTASQVDLNRFAQIIVRHLDHIEYLELSISDKVDLSQLASLSVASSMPLLRTVKLGSWSAQDSVPVAHFLSAPLLRSVHITRSPSPFKLLLPWSQLSNLILEGVSGQSTATILRQTVNLVHLRLRVISPLDFPSDAVEPLSRLESLEVDCGSISSFSSLSLPALRTLKITQCLFIRDLSRLNNDFSRWRCLPEMLHVTAKRNPENFGTSTQEECRAKFPSIPTVLVEEY